MNNKQLKFATITEKSYTQSDIVYDLSVDKDTSYNVNSLIVHNSAVGSLVAYVLDIHRVNPMDERWGIDGLPFERFLSNERGIKKVILKGNGEQYEMLETDSARIIRDGEEIEIKAIDIMQGDEFIEKIK